MISSRTVSIAWLSLVWVASASAQNLNAPAAEALMKKSNCFKCHSVDKKKDGPSYKEVLAKHKGEADLEQKLFVHLTTTPMVKVDGNEEEHEALKTKKEEDVRNVIRWILSR